MEINYKEAVSFLKLKEFRKLALNFSVRSIFLLISKIFPIITFPIILNVLTPDEYGYFNIFLIIVNYSAMPISLLGMNAYAIRELVSKNMETNVTNEVLSNQLLVAIFSFLIGFGVSVLLFYDNFLLIICILISYIILFSGALNIEFYFISKKNLLIPTLANFLSQLIYLFGIIFFARKENGLITIVILSSSIPLILNLILYWFYYRDGNTIKIYFSIHKVLSTYKRTYQIGLANNLESFYSTIPMLILPMLATIYALGIYAASYKIFSIITIFYITFFTALAPYIVKLRTAPSDKKIKSLFLILVSVLLMAFLISIITFLLSLSPMGLLFGTKFNESIYLVRILCFTLIPIYPIFMLLGNVLIYFEMEKYYLYSLIIAVAVVLFTTPIFINMFGISGCIYSQTIALIIALVYAFYSFFNSEPEIVLIIKNKFLK
jgi:polysaccharide transporter, PST family